MTSRKTGGRRSFRYIISRGISGSTVVNAIVSCARAVFRQTYARMRPWRGWCSVEKSEETVNTTINQLFATIWPDTRRDTFCTRNIMHIHYARDACICSGVWSFHELDVYTAKFVRIVHFIETTRNRVRFVKRTNAKHVLILLPVNINNITRVVGHYVDSQCRHNNNGF